MRRILTSLKFFCTLKRGQLLIHLIWLLTLGRQATGQTRHANTQNLIDVGAASADITPSGPIRLAGYGSRNKESDSVLQRIHAKALAIGSDAQGPSVLITVDLLGIPEKVTNAVAQYLFEKKKIARSRVAICADHIHTGPIIGDVFVAYPDQPWPSEQFEHILLYADQLVKWLEQLSLEALANRRASKISWGVGDVKFATNRRVLKDGKWVGFGAVPDGPVDHAMSLLRIQSPDGQLRAVLVNYACHATTLGADINSIHGDWPGEAQRIIEEKYPDCVAMIALGCAADADPQPRLKLEYTTLHGQEIASEVFRLVDLRLKPITALPEARSKKIALPYDRVPTLENLIADSKGSGGHAEYARSMLVRLAHGDSIASALTYTIQTWVFGKNLAMIFMPGEVVVDYSLRLKKELDRSRIWINAYANAMPCYIASKRLYFEGGYEVDDSLFGYDKPGRFAPGNEDLIIRTILSLLPKTYRSSGPEALK